ncbi:MAG: DUF975 family protein [Roseburia sp.]
MWTRKELKQKAKARISLNYWRCVLVALLLCVIAGGTGASSAFSGSGSDGANYVAESWQDELVNGDHIRFEKEMGVVDEIRDIVNAEFFDDNELTNFDVAVIIGVAAVIFLVVALIVGAILLLLQVFLFNPLLTGCKRFFTRNLSDTAQVKEICFNFDNNYMNGVKIMFFKGLYTFLWSLLFIIPGIIKAYEYQMVPYILAENPDITKEAAFSMSKRMMDGNKWKAFVLDLSFLGWEILSGMTLGILGIFYVNPYRNQTEAALYEALKNEQNYTGIEQNGQNAQA